MQSTDFLLWMAVSEGWGAGMGHWAERRGATVLIKEVFGKYAFPGQLILHGRQTWRTNGRIEREKGKLRKLPMTAVKCWQKKSAWLSFSPLTSCHFTEIFSFSSVYLGNTDLSPSPSNVKCFFSSDLEPVAESSPQEAKPAIPVVKTHFDSLIFYLLIKGMYKMQQMQGNMQSCAYYSSKIWLCSVSLCIYERSLSNSSFHSPLFLFFLH